MACSAHSFPLSGFGPSRSLGLVPLSLPFGPKAIFFFFSPQWPARPRSWAGPADPASRSPPPHLSSLPLPTGARTSAPSLLFSSCPNRTLPPAEPDEATRPASAAAAPPRTLASPLASSRRHQSPPNPSSSASASSAAAATSISSSRRFNLKFDKSTSFGSTPRTHRVFCSSILSSDSLTDVRRTLQGAVRRQSSPSAVLSPPRPLPSTQVRSPWPPLSIDPCPVPFRGRNRHSEFRRRAQLTAGHGAAAGRPSSPASRPPLAHLI